jgi:hypothetical protein
MNGEETIALWERCQNAGKEAAHLESSLPLQEKVALWRNQAISGDRAQADDVASAIWNAWALSVLSKRRALEKADKWKVSYRYDYWWEEHVAVGANEETARWFEEATANFVDFAFPAGNSAHFRKFIFPGPALFWIARFQDEALFDDAVFHDTAWFSGAEFSNIAEFRNCEFKDRVRFRRTKFHGNVRFNRCRFLKLAFFSQCTFDSFTSFKEAEFCNDADFSAIHVMRAFELSACSFAKVPSFNQADFKQPPDLDNVRFRLPGFWRGRGAGLAAKYRAIRRMAIQGADYEREQMAFKGEIRSRRGTEHKPWHIAFWFGLAYDALSDFGRSIGRPLALWGLSILIFAGIYLWNAGIGLDRWNETCEAAKAARWEKALTLSFSNAIVLGSPRNHDINAIYACLYDWDAAQSLPEGRRLPLPRWSTAIQIVQSLSSAVLIFLFLLGVRNQFKIK